MLEDLKKHYVWKEVMKLSTALVELCEEFTDDKNVVVWHLRQSIMDIPAQVSTDLLHRRPATLDPLVRCATQLELVRKIYPAADTDPAEEVLQKILTIIDEGKFNDRPGGGSHERLISQADAVAAAKKQEEE